MAKKYSIMVVDDDRRNLDKLRPYISGKGHLSNFCTSMSEAKSLMVGVYPDVFISRPNIHDGSDSILPYVSEKFPNAIRIAFDEEGEKSNLMRQVASGNAHRYICLSWDSNKMRSAVFRDIHTRARINLHRCWKYIVRNKINPALPAVVKDIEVLVSNEDFSLDKLVSLIERDPVIAANILKIVNSAAYPKNGIIGDLFHAVNYLGPRQVRELILFICVRDSLPLSPKLAQIAEEVAVHSFKCSRLAGMIAEEMLPGKMKTAVTAALLHDMGKFLFFTYAENNPYLQFKELRSFFDVAASEYEIEEFGVTHAQLGGALMLWWNLPMSIVETVANHTMDINKLNGIARVVAIADRCLMEANPGLDVITDIETLAEKLPIDKWREVAIDILDDKDVPFN